MPWVPIWILPNISIDEPIEGGTFALAPHDDERIRAMERDHVEFATFIARFTDTFGVPLNPAIIIRRVDVLDEFGSAQAAASFRDLVAASIVPLNRSLNLVYNNGRNQPSYSSHFFVYPWTIGRDFEHVVASTPAIWGLHDVNELRAQSSPDLTPVHLQRSRFDEPLLAELMRRWSRRYGAQPVNWKDIALFRSLNMAYHAMLVPGGADAVFHDLGRTVAHWVSAFEILRHPGGREQVNREKVFAMLERAPWDNEVLGHRRYKIRIGGADVRKNLACWVYNALNACRNDFLHGNPVDDTTLQLAGSRRSPLEFAAPLYRIGLAAFLELTWNGELVETLDAEEFVRRHQEKEQFIYPQSMAERALLRSRVSIAELEARRRGLLEEHRRRQEQRRNAQRAQQVQ